MWQSFGLISMKKASKLHKSKMECLAVKTNQAALFIPLWLTGDLSALQCTKTPSGCRPWAPADRKEGEELTDYDFKGGVRWVVVRFCDSDSSAARCDVASQPRAELTGELCSNSWTTPSGLQLLHCPSPPVTTATHTDSDAARHIFPLGGKKILQYFNKTRWKLSRQFTIPPDKRGVFPLSTAPI